MPQQSGTYPSSVVVSQDFHFGLPTSSSIRQVAPIATKFLQRIAGSLTSTNEKWAAPFRAGVNRQFWSVSSQFSDTPPSRFLFLRHRFARPVAARTYPRAAPRSAGERSEHPPRQMALS